ncbi:MAG: AAA family ATPase [Alphaproteobacteria bacterium]
MSNVDLVQNADYLSERLQAAKSELGKVIFGQDQVIEQSLIALLSGGHALLVGVPGLAKTKLVTSISQVLALPSKRVQCTPDLMPADILGAEVLEETAEGKRQFRFIEGPVFTNLLMADEINRASPRTQSALLQAMQEREVSIAGQNMKLPTPFHVFATQNPIEQEGTYPLPEAQLDRFLLDIRVDYPDADAERRMLIETTTGADESLGATMSTDDLLAGQALVRAMPIGEQVVDAILTLVRSARPSGDANSDLSWGAGPRAGQALMLAVRAKALIDGRYAPSLDDVVTLAPAVLRHRVALSFGARAEGQTNETYIANLLSDFA